MYALTYIDKETKTKTETFRFKGRSGYLRDVSDRATKKVINNQRRGNKKKYIESN